MVLAGHQPNYLPNLAYFAKMARVDKFIIATNIQVERDKSWQRRNHIPGDHGNIWLTVPVFGSAFQTIRDVQINHELPWQRKHTRTLQERYGHAPYATHLPELLAIYEQKHARLADLNCALIKHIATLLGLAEKIVVDEEVTGSKHELVINTCQKYGATQYVAGSGGRDYMDQAYCAALADHGISVLFMPAQLTHNYPYATVHYLLTEGPAWVKEQLYAEPTSNDA